MLSTRDYFRYKGINRLEVKDGRNYFGKRVIKEEQGYL